MNILIPIDKAKNAFKRLVDNIRHSWLIEHIFGGPVVYGLIYKVKCWLFRPYTTIKPRTMGHTWADKSELLPHMMFEIFCKFMEEECYVTDDYKIGEKCWIRFEGIKGKHMIEVNGKKKWVWTEMAEIYKWWKEEYVPLWNGVHPKMVQIEQDMKKYGQIEGTDLFVKSENGPYFEFKPTYKNKKLHDKASEKYWKFEEDMDNKLVEMMKRMSDIHGYMWT
jgi:hypothetical protein